MRVSSRFSFSRSNDSSPHGHWFRVGTLEVTSSILFVLVSGVFILSYAFAGALHRYLALNPGQVLHGFVWQILTWPFSQLGLSIWTLIALALIWVLGRELEADIGRFRFARFLVGCTVVLALLTVALSLIFYGPIDAPLLAGPQLLQFVLLLVYIGQYPQRRFFFNIPGWVLGAAFVGIQVIVYLGSRYWFGLIQFVLGLIACALVARSVGLLAEVRFLGQRRRRTPKAKRPREGKGMTPTVVPGPWPKPPSNDQEALDLLLDKIHATGMDSLTAREKKQLLVLRERLRGQ